MLPPPDPAPDPGIVALPGMRLMGIGKCPEEIKSPIDQLEPKPETAPPKAVFYNLKLLSAQEPGL